METKHKAILTIHNLPDMTSKDYRQLRDWLYGVMNQMSVLDKKKFNKKMVYRLMK